MKSKLALLFVVVVSLSVSAGPVKASSESLAGSIFGNCARLNKVYPRGVAISSTKARLQKVKPAVNRGIYLKNIKLDRDKDGTACESSSSGSPTVPGGSSGSVGTSPKYVCPTGTWVFTVTKLEVTLTLPTTYPGVNNYFFTVSGLFTNSTNAIVFPNSMFARVAFSPNVSNANRIPKNSPTEINLLLDGPRFEVAPGASETVSGTGVVESLSTPSLVTGGAQVMWNDPKNVAYCPVPTKR